MDTDWSVRVRDFSGSLVSLSALLFSARLLRHRSNWNPSEQKLTTARSEEPLIPLHLAIARELTFRRRFPDPVDGRDWTPLPPPAVGRSPAHKTDGDSVLAERAPRWKRLVEIASAVRSDGASEAMPAGVVVGWETVWRSRLRRGSSGLRLPARKPTSSGGDDFVAGTPVFAPVEGDKCYVWFKCTLRETKETNA